MTNLAHLPSRGVIDIAGDDRITFLQGLVSNDVTQAAPGRAVWTAFLSPQGKWLSDFFVLAEAERLLLDCPGEHIAALLAKLSRFRLRSKVTLRDASAELAVHAAWGGTPELPPGSIAAPDPRLPDAGDLDPDRTLLLEAGFDELNGVSWSKGCYMGQELTARSKYRGLVKRRLVPVAVDGPLPAPFTPVLLDGQGVGSLRSVRGAAGLAVLRLEALEAGALDCGEARLTPHVPAWLRLPQTAA